MVDMIPALSKCDPAADLRCLDHRFGGGAGAL
jgi:hypothetical protein